MKQSESDLLVACRLIQGVATAPTPTARKNVLRLALVAFDHNDSGAHDNGASGIPVLVRCLERAAVHTIWAEVDCLCRLLSMLFRCSDENAILVFQKVGASLVGVLLCILNQMSDASRGEGSRISLLDAVYALLEKIASLEVSLQSTGNSSQLLRLLQQVIRNCDGFFFPVQTESMRLLAGLARHRDSKVVIMQYPSLVEDVLSYQLTVGCEYYTASFLRHLAWEKHSQVELLRMKKFLPTLLTLCECSHVPTRVEALRTFRLLAGAAGAKPFLAKSQRVLKRLVVNMTEQDLRVDALETVILLIGQETFGRLINFPGLVKAIVSVALQVSNGDIVTPIAAQSLKRLSTYLRVCDRKHPQVIEALVKLSSSSNVSVRVWVARAFLEQSRLASSRFYLVRTPDVMNVVMRLCSDSVPWVQSAATEALLNLGATKANQKLLLAHGSVLRTMVDNALSSYDTECEWRSKTNRFAIQLILSLIDVKSERTRVAKELNLLLCLSQFAVSQDTDKELRQAALHGVIVLAPLV